MAENTDIAVAEITRHIAFMTTYNGTIEELRDLVAAIPIAGEWNAKPNSVWRFKAATRAGLNWSVTKGTVWYDGPDPAKTELNRQIDEALKTPVAQRRAATGEPIIFVVHGHDHTAKEQLELILHKLNLEPFVLQDSGGGGKTIIEALEKMIGKDAESSFGIILLTPDDLGYSKQDGDKDVKPRARQNVILEMGMLLSSLTRARVAILQKGFVERPSDLEGVLYIPFNDHVREVIPKLVQRLQEEGIPIDGTAIARASS